MLHVDEFDNTENIVNANIKQEESDLLGDD